MKQTTNYGLNKPELTDSPDITALNHNFDTIDGNLKSVSDRLATAENNLTGKAPKNHATSSTTYGVGTSTYHGHVRLSDSTASSSSTSSGIAATPKAVKTAYDMGKEAKTSAETAQASADSKLPLSGGNVTGSLTVQNKPVVRSVNGTDANASGNVTLTKQNIIDSLGYTPVTTVDGKTGNVNLSATYQAKGDYLLKSGGTMKGTIQSSNAVTIVSTANDSSICLYGGTASANGASLLLRGKDHVNAGQVMMYANDGTNTNSLIVRPDGSAVVNGKNIVRSINGTTADSDGNVKIANPQCYVITSLTAEDWWFRVWSNGWVEQGGSVYHSGNNVRKYVTLPVMMKDTNYTVLASSSFVLMDNNWDRGIAAARPYSVSQIYTSNGRDATTVTWMVQGWGA